MENTHEPLEHNKLDTILDGAAGIVGKTIWGTGYAAGRIAPKVRRVAKAIADTKMCTFIGTHFSDGFTHGETACILAEAEAEAARMIETGGAVMKEAAAQFLARIKLALGSDPQTTR